MDKILTGYKRKFNSTGDENSDVGTSSESKRNKEQEGSTAKKRKYDPSYLSFGFTSVINAEVEKPMCLLCSLVCADIIREKWGHGYIYRGVDLFLLFTDIFRRK